MELNKKIMITGLVMVAIILAESVIGCNVLKSSDSNDKKGPCSFPIYIYKTRGDYYNLVMVRLSEEKIRVTAYPDISDISLLEGTDSDGNYLGSFPIKLHHDYLLGAWFSENTAFLDITYEDYKKLDRTPTPQELFDMIIDDDPFTELHEYHVSLLPLNIKDIVYFNEIVDNELVDN